MKLFFTLSVFFWCMSVAAGPMGFQDSVMTMGDVGPNWKEVFSNYALTPRDALGASYTYMRADDQSKTRNLTEVIYTRLLHRKNLPHAQANFWLIGGVGSVTGNDFDGDKFAYTPGLQADYETRRVYVSATARLYRAQDIRHDFFSARAGFSFYETEYDQTQPWFIVEARRMHDLSEQTEITPMFRLINKRYFVEFGVNTDGLGRFNFMYIF